MDFTQKDVEILFSENGNNICTNFLHFSKYYSIYDKKKATECFIILIKAYKRVCYLNKLNSYQNTITRPTLKKINDDYLVSGFIPFTVEMGNDIKEIKKISLNHFDSY